MWAAVYDAPVVFYCQNNQWAISEPLERQTRVPLYQRARGYGFPGVRVDGNDVLACLAAPGGRWTSAAPETGRLIEAVTYRMDAHTTSDDPSRYRLADELELWKLKDPIERVRVHLVREQAVGQEFFAEVAAESDALADRFRGSASRCRTRDRSGFLRGVRRRAAVAGRPAAGRARLPRKPRPELERS